MFCGLGFVILGIFDPESKLSTLPSPQVYSAVSTVQVGTIYSLASFSPPGPNSTEQKKPLGRTGVGRFLTDEEQEAQKGKVFTWGPSDRALKTAPPPSPQVRLFLCDFLACVHVQRAVLWPERERKHGQAHRMLESPAGFPWPIRGFGHGVNFAENG